MTEQEIRNQIEGIFSLNKIKEIDERIEELITNNKEYESLIRNLYDQKKSLLFKTKTYDELVSIYPDLFDSPIWKHDKKNNVNFINDLFRYLTEDEVFEKVKNVGLRNGPFYYDGQVFSKLSNQHKNEIIKATLSDDNVIELVRGSSNRELFDTAKSKVSPLKFLQLLNNENNINLYTADEVLNIIKKIPTIELQLLLKNLFILNKSPEIASYISKQCNLDSYTLNPYSLKDEINIEIIKNMSLEQLNNSVYVFKDCSDTLFNYFYNNYDINFLIKHYWGKDERTKKILDKVEKIDEIEKDYINKLTTIKDSEYVLEKLEKYNFKNEDLYNYIGRLINLSSETKNYCTKKLGVESILAYIGNYKNSIQDKRLEYLDSIQDELIHAFYSDGFRLEEIEAKLSFLKKHNMGEENLIKILNGWHCDDALMKFLIDEYGIDFVISNYQQKGYYNSFYSNLSKEKIMLDAITDIKGYKDIYLKLLLKQDGDYISSKLQTFNFSVHTLINFLEEIDFENEDIIKKEKLILDTITDIKGIEKFYLEFLFKQDAEYITKKLKQFNVSKELLFEHINNLYNVSDNLFKGILNYKFEIIWNNESLLWKLDNEQLKSILNKVQKIDKKYINFLIKTGDSKFIEDKINEHKISFNQLYQSKWHASLRDILKETDLNDFSKLFDAFSTHDNYSKEELNIILSKLESVEGIEHDFLRVITTSFSRVDGEFILEQLKKYNIDYKYIKDFYNDSWWIGLNKNLDEYLEANYGTFYNLEKIIWSFSQEDIPKIKQLIDSAKSFKGAESILIESLRNIDDIDYIIDKLKQFNLDKNILSKLKFSFIIDKDLRLLDTFCELYGVEYVLKNYKNNNQEILKSLLNKTININDKEIQNDYLNQLSQLKDSKFIIEKICNLKFSQDIFSNYLTNILDKDLHTNEVYMDIYGEEHNLNNAIVSSLEEIFGLDYLVNNYQGNNFDVCKYLLEKNLGKEELKSLGEEKINAYVSAYQAFYNKQLYFKFINKEFSQKLLEITGIDILIYLKSNIYNQDESVINIINGENNFKDVFNLLKGIYKDDSAYGVNFFNKAVHFYKNYSELCNQLNSNINITEIQKKNLITLLNRKDTLKIKSVYDLTIVDELIDEEINDVLASSKIDILKLKDVFLRNFINVSFYELRNIFDNHMSVSTLEKILAKEMNENDRKYIESLYCLFSFLNETINSTNDIDSLKNMLKLINTKEKRENVSEIYNCFSNIMEAIRRVYEIDANISLTNLSALPKNLYNSQKGYYDLSQSEFGLYAHVTSMGYLGGLINPSFVGYNFICLSPISDKMVKGFYNSGITILYDKIPEGAFIGSSIANVGSNARMKTNNFDINDLIRQYHQFEFKDSSSISEFGRRSHSETNCWRDGMIPSGVLIRGDSPTEMEKEAAEILRKLTGKSIPLVKVQEIGKSIENPQKIKYETELTKTEEQIDEYKALRKQLEEVKLASSELVKKDDITEIENRRYATGASHDLFFCKINGEEYLLKPGTDRSLRNLETHRVHANYIGYKIQELVNPETAIEIKKVEAPIFSDGSTVLCAATKIKSNTKDFEYLDEQSYPANNYHPLNETQVSSICKELIVDYLIFNLDAKGANFITDGNLVYGIDKEQAVKFALNANTNLDYTANASNALQSMYTNVFEAYKSGKQDIPYEVFEEMESIAERITNMSDEEYYEIFSEYVECQRANQEEYKNIILARKNALYSEILKLEEDLGVRRGR